MSQGLEERNSGGLKVSKGQLELMKASKSL